MIRIQPLLFALALGAATMTGLCQQSPGWRVYRASDGLPESACRYVTLGGAGNVFVEGLNSKVIAQCDGYSWTNLSAAPVADAVGALSESPAGQLWIASAQGLCEWVNGVWRLHPIPEIAERHRAAPGIPIPLCPVRQNVVIFLLPDRLMEYAADHPDQSSVRTLRSVNQTGLGQFTGMRAAFDDNLWISGERGLAKIPGPKRTIGAQSVWQEFICPANLALRHLRQPQCADDDSVTCVADAATGTDRAIVSFDGQNWASQSVGSHRIQFAWLGPDQILWAATPDALFRIQAGKPVMDDELALGAVFDVALGAHGMFWLATSEGLFCRVAEAWRPASDPPPNLFVSNQVALIAQNGDRWVAGDSGISWLHEQRWTTFSHSEALAPRDAVALVEMPDGKIWCATAEKIWAFDGQNWGPVRSGLGRINAMMRSSDGSVWVASTEGLHRCLRGNWIDIGVEEGLSSAVALDVRQDASDRIWASTVRGLALFHPEADIDPPRTFLRLPSARERNIPQGGSVTLNFWGRDKWNVTPPGRLLYSWRLDDGDWSPFDSPTSTPFIDLPAGKHYFQVRAMDRNGNMDNQPRRMEFAVILPWYEEGRSIWIAGIGAAAALFFAGLAYKRHHELVLSHAQVEKEVAQRTAELKLANQELLQSQKMKALGTLAAGIAHDFNNILSIIKGSAQIIEQNVGDPQKIRARADRIKTVVDQGSAVVQALLGFSRNSEESIEVCDVNVVVENTIRLLGDRFLRETAVRFDGGFDLPSVRISKGLMQQILLNFIFNAAESMPQRKEVIIATAHAAKVPDGVALSPRPASDYVCISVRDFGCGIAVEIMPRIFEPFFTTKALSSRRGTGLGLSVAYELAQKMGAGLAVESAPGQGSVFTLILGAAVVAESVAVES